MKTSQSIAAIAPAFVKAQAEFQAVGKDKTAKIGGAANYSYKYADLAAIMEEIRPILGKYKLAVIQTTSQPHDSTMAVTTTVLHESGEWIEGEPLILPVDGDRSQSIGSAVTYARRYSMGPLLGIVTDEDDDGAQANRPAGQKPVVRPQPRPEPTPPRDDAALNGLAVDLLGHLTKLDRETWEPRGISEVHLVFRGRAMKQGVPYDQAFLTGQIRTAVEALNARHADTVARVAAAKATPPEAKGRKQRHPAAEVEAAVEAATSQVPPEEVINTEDIPF